MKLAASEGRKTTSEAISSGRAIRLRGVRAASDSRYPGRHRSVISEAKNPGASALTRMDLRPTTGRPGAESGRAVPDEA